MSKRRQRAVPRTACACHPRRQARVSCRLCGVPLCRQCARSTDGGAVCRDTGACAARVAHRKVAEHAPASASQAVTGDVPLRTRVLRATTGSLAGLAFASCALFPCVVRWGWAEAARSRTLSERQAFLESALANRARENRDLADELRRLKDSTLTAIDSWRATPRPPRAAMTGLLFDSRLPASFDNGDRKLKAVALTFDADAHANAAEEILDTLASRGVRVTMFLSGQFMLRHPELVRRIVAEGHEVGNHLYSHPRLTSWAQDRTHTTLPSVTRAMLFAELGRTEHAFESVTGRQIAPLWRAPYGERNRTICAWGQEAGYLHVGWRQGRSWRENLDSNDWVPDEDDPGYHSPDDVLRKIVDAAQQGPYGINGGIILMHLGTLRRKRSQQVHLVLGRLIDHLRGLGYELVTVTRMAQLSGVDLALLRPAEQTAANPSPPRRQPH